MAEHTPPAMDYDEHRRTYALFVALSKWGAIFSAGVLVLMAIFLL